MVKYQIVIVSLVVALMGCQQSQDVTPPKPPAPPNSAPQIRAVPPEVPKEVRTSHYQSVQGQEYVYLTLTDDPQPIIVRFLGEKNGRYVVQIDSQKETHRLLSCDLECLTVSATNYFNDQIIATESFTGPGSIEAIIMQDAKAGLLKQY